MNETKTSLFQKQIDLIRPIKESWMNFTNVEQSNNQFMVKQKKSIYGHMPTRKGKRDIKNQLPLSQCKKNKHIQI